MKQLDSTVAEITERITERSTVTRAAYLDRIKALTSAPSGRAAMGCTNLAHAFAASPANDKLVLHAERAPNLAIVTAYNDMLSAHQPYEHAPERIREAARAVGATAQVAGGTPAMCGVCDKIVPGLLMGALSFGHLPAVFIPAGPMTSGIPNKDKARTRQRFAEGKATREELLESESASYHGPGTCTFYGTANSNQMMMEVMGLHLPGAAFINPGTDLRAELTTAAAQRALAITKRGNEFTPVGAMIDEKAIVNAIIGLLATGGSTNHTLHLVAIARTAGININWDDFDQLSHTIPLLTHVYPSGQADVNQFHAAGGMSLVIRELLDAGMLHNDVQTVAGAGGLSQYIQEPWLDNGVLTWREGSKQSLDDTIISSASAPFQADGGLRLMSGNLGRAVIKTSAVKPEHRIVEAPAKVFYSQDALRTAFENDELNEDFIAVVAYQGPRANGMPELHKLTPILGVLLDRGYSVGLVTDGRMSGASGKVPAAIHVSPECLLDGPLRKVRDGDMIRMDAEAGTLNALVDAADWESRYPEHPDLSRKTINMGRELFTAFRHHVSSAESGAVSVFDG